ncbi:MAG: family 10 glycosylhydrolase [Melioribacteraceae bacterium]|nr:family 10 glycosylhydrolase [Melioribacteraceae bacterium]
MKKEFIFILIFISISLTAQVNRETRAVWLTTNFRLDWPPTSTDPKIQKSELKKIFDDIKSKRLNTVYFQVRSNGTVMFRSSFEPLSPYISGEVDGKSSYDPLKYAIELAHERGIEIHAWVNVVRCFTGNEKFIFEHPYHIAQRKPQWVIENNRDGKSYWLDMGLPEVRTYLIAIFDELVKNYDVDGLHLDFLRYPGKDFNDDFSFNLYGEGLSLDDWRRDNLNVFVKELSQKVKSVKPLIKIGAAPIGIYKNSSSGSGFEGYGEVYQDSREWLKQKWIDYLVPQIYWPMEGPPRFDKLAIDWTNDTFGRSVVLGVAPYKPEVKKQLKRIIDFTRTTKADGIAFFRYGNIKDVFPFTNDYVALPAKMPWIESSIPLEPADLMFNYDSFDASIVTLEWEKPTYSNQLDSTSYFALYSLPDRNAKPSGDTLFEIISSDKNSIKIAIDKPKRINYYFTLKSLNKLWNESINTSNMVEVTFRELSVVADMNKIYESPVLVKEKNETPKILLYSNKEDQIKILDSGGKIVKEANVFAGKNIISLNTSDTESLIIQYVSSGKEVKLPR